MPPKQLLRRLRAIERLQRSIRAKYLYTLNPTRGSPLLMALEKKMAVDLIEYYQLHYNELFNQYQTKTENGKDRFIFQQ
jgi:hypothetical protein